MDRQLLLGLGVSLLLLGGCSKSKPPATAKAGAGKPPAAAAAPEAQPQFTETHRPVTVDASAVAAQRAAELARIAEAEKARQKMYRSKTEYEFPDSIVEGALEKPPSADSPQPTPAAPPAEGHNPLRRNAPPTESAPRVNPLREMQVAPPASASAAPLAMAQPPPASPPAETVPSLESAAVIGAPRMAGPPGAESPPAGMLAGLNNPAAGGGGGGAGENGDYHVVEVFYGTDRRAAEQAPGDWPHVLRCYWPTATTAFAALALAFVATSRRSLILALTAFVGVGLSVGLAYQDTAVALAVVRHAGKLGPQYTSDRSPGGKIDRGVCEVTIPRTHEVGEVESPSLTRLEVLEDASRHVVLHKTERLIDARFYGLLRERVAQSAKSELFVFVHGFNVSFEDAARRTAQIHHDLQFDGAPIFFSWPAHDKFVFTYPADETNVSWSVPHLKQFLLEIVKESKARSINLIAHSMGNRALAAALREIELEMHDRARLFNQVILAAPDIDADDFRYNIAPAMQRTAQRLTLYASARDDALLASQLVHRGPRAGDAGEGLVVVSGIDTIDVTAIDSSPWGHSYYGSSDPVLHDLRALFSRAIPPRDRTWLSPAQRDGLTYWIFQPTRTAAADGSANR